MTTVQTMLARTPRLALVALATALCGLLGACHQRNTDRLEPPHVLVSPYHAVGGDVVWCVAPLRNEAGTDVVDSLLVTDALVNKVTEVEGLAAMPTDRTLGAMQALGLRSISTADEALLLAQTLGVDGIIVGSITAYDPYDPPKLGLSLALFVRGAPRAPDVDPQSLRGAYSDEEIPITVSGTGPGASVSLHLDGASHATQIGVRRYATGRHDAESALGWRRFLASMELYTDFAAWTALERLLDAERLRISRLAATQPAG